MGEEMPMLYSRELHLTQSTWDGGIIMLQNSSRMCSFIRYAAIALLMIAICALVALVALPGRASADVGSEEMYRVYNPTLASISIRLMLLKKITSLMWAGHTRG